MNKQEILNEINKTKEHLADMEKILADCKCEYKRWKPEKGDKYYFVSNAGSVYSMRYEDTIFENKIIDIFYNCFQTREQAEVEAEKILVRRMLEDIARRLNKNRKINWNDDCQFKYFIYFDYFIGQIDIYYRCYQREQGVVYCLDKNFKDVAIQEIGEERLKKYLRGE